MGVTAGVSMQARRGMRMCLATKHGLCSDIIVLWLVSLPRLSVKDLNHAVFEYVCLVCHAQRVGAEGFTSHDCEQEKMCGGWSAV